MEHQLSPETFFAGVEMLQQQLRVKRDDQWSAAVCKLKFHSFQSEFPEVSDPQFFWACERWIQEYSSKDFVRMPTWGQLMAPLYATETGQANRSWGFKRDLPAFVSPTSEQKAMLPEKARSIAGAADPQNAAAYVPFEGGGNLLLPSMTAASGDELTNEEWARYLRELARDTNAASD